MAINNDNETSEDYSDEEDTLFQQNKIAYLAQIEDVINRLSTISTTFKGLIITLFVGILTIVISLNNSLNIAIILPICIVILVLAGYDAWYFKLELRYRELYREVCAGEHPINFDMQNDKNIHIKFSTIIKSKSIWIFYLVIVLIIIIYVLIYLCFYK